ncbi:MAG: L-glutamate gamma-semialdehyde dehydrogenase, partial [Cytophagales bacterium]
MFTIPTPINEPVYSYAPNTNERELLLAAVKEAKSFQKDIPMYIGGKEIRTGNKVSIHPPHEKAHILGYFHLGTAEHVNQAIEAALQAKESWEFLPWEQKAAIFLKAADLIAGPYRYKINAAAMLCQSKSVHQAEIDAACELADFLRYNVYFAQEIYKIQPVSSPGVWNRMEYRPLEGFIYALTPFNFTAIAGNLPTVCALMGNVVVWKAAEQQTYASALIMEILIESGLPGGVINLVHGSGPMVGDTVTSHPDFTGIHFTGSTSVFKTIWRNIAKNLDIYKSYPRIVGETGGKDFVVAHESADPTILATALVRGSFEYQGQKCSASSRAYIPKKIWDETWKIMETQLKSIKMGSTEDLSNFVNAVITKRAYDSIVDYIEKARANPKNTIIAGGKYDESVGYFIEPTVILTTDPKSLTMVEEIFGPVLTIYVYEKESYEELLKLVDSTSEYSLTGAVIAQD